MKKITSIILSVFIIWIFSIYLSYNNFKNQILTEKELDIKIENWETIESLFQKEFSINKYFLKIYLRKNTPDWFIVQKWNFKIREKASFKEVFEDLENPIFEEINVTILEWWNIYDIDECLSSPEISWCLYITGGNSKEKRLIKNPLLEKGEYISYVTNKQKIDALSELWFPFIEGSSTLEWFLYPDTYKIFPTNFKINNFVILQLNTFESKVIKEIEKKYSPEKWQEIVNLASIVEKEERKIEEKATVAWILKKRLNEWWMIWADITVCYPHELTSQECKMVVSKYINEKSEYNTRTMTWLPKTPIWNPSFETIFATINSKESPYYYYLHDKTWEIHYAKTNLEHEENKIKYIY